MALLTGLLKDVRDGFDRKILDLIYYASSIKTSFETKYVKYSRGLSLPHLVLNFRLRIKINAKFNRRSHYAMLQCLEMLAMPLDAFVSKLTHLPPLLPFLLLVHIWQL